MAKISKPGPRFQPIDFVSTFVHNPGRPVMMRAGPFEIVREDGTIKFNDALATEFAKEAITYKNFWVAANDYAKLMETKAQGKYVHAVLEQHVMDTYLMWRNKCLELDVVLDPISKTEH